MNMLKIKKNRPLVFLFCHPKIVSFVVALLAIGSGYLATVTSSIYEEQLMTEYSSVSPDLIIPNRFGSLFKNKERYLIPLSTGEEPEGYIVSEETIKEMQMLAQLIQAEAGNQDLDGKRLVADVVLNRVDSEKFKDQNDVKEVIYADKQFSVIKNGAFRKAENEISEDCYKAVQMEWKREDRLDKNVLYFNIVYENGVDPFKHGDHWFSY